MQSIRCDSAQCSVIQHHHRIRILRQPPHGQQTIIRMHHHIPRIRRVWKHTIRLNNLLRESIIQSLQQKRSQSRSSPTSNRMQHHETLQGVRAVCLAIYHLHDVFVHGLASLVTVTPVIGCANAVFADEEVFGVVDVFVGAGLNAVDDL